MWGWPSGWMTVRINPDIVYKWLCRCWPHRAEFITAESGACQDLPLDMLLVKLIGSCSDIVWNWPLGVFVLGPLGKQPMSDTACDWPWTTFLKLVFGCLCKALVCTGRTKLYTMAGFYQQWAQKQVSKSLKVLQDLPLPASPFWLIIRLSHWKSLLWYSSYMR